MSKTSYLNLTNRILSRINQTTIADVTAASGIASIVTNLYNEAQNNLFTEEDWYSLYTMRTFSTVTYTASTISFADTGPDTILDSASGMGSFEAGMEVMVSGSSSNDGLYKVDTAAAGTLTLQSSDALTTEAAGESITITAVSYPVATDHGRTLDLMDATNDYLLNEGITKLFDLSDPNTTLTGIPTEFDIQGGTFRLYPIPAGTYKLRERYFKVPTALAANSDTSDLPIEVENLLIKYTYIQILEYMNKFELADRVRINYNSELKTARAMNQKKINKLRIINPIMGSRGMMPVRFPSGYPNA